MKLITGTVVEGKVEIPPETLAEGASVTVLVPEAGGPLGLRADEEEALVQAMEEIRRGEYVDGVDLLQEIRSRSRG